MRQVVSEARLEIVRVVRGRDLHGAGAELGVHERIRDDGDFPVQERQAQMLAHEVLVSLIVGMDGHGRIAEHGLGARRRDGDAVSAVPERVVKIPQVAVVFFVLDFQVGNGRLAPRAPVHQIVVAVDQPLFVEPHKGLAHGAGESLVHCEPLALPVARSAQVVKLADDGSAALGLPLPDALDEFLTPQRFARLILLGELALHHVLGGDARVVGAGHPADAQAAHPFPADEDILQGIVQGVAHVERARHVRGRDDDGVRLVALAGRAVKISALQPLGIPAIFGPFRVVAGFQQNLFSAFDFVDFSNDDFLYDIGELFYHGVFDVAEQRRRDLFRSLFQMFLDDGGECFAVEDERGIGRGGLLLIACRFRAFRFDGRRFNGFAYGVS